MCTIHFHLRPSTRGRDFEGSLFIRVIHERKALNVTTPYRLYPSEWDKRHHCILYRADAQPGVPSASHPGAALRSYYKNDVEKMMIEEKDLLLSIAASLEEQGEYAVSDIVRLYRLRKSGVPLLPFAEKLACHLEDQGQYRTARAYRTVSRGLTAFAGKEGFTLSDIRPALLKSFQEDLLKKGKTLNTVSFYMRNLRAIYNRAVREQLIDIPRRNPFDEVYTGVEQTRKRALNKEEMALLSQNLLSLVHGMSKENPATTTTTVPDTTAPAIEYPRNLRPLQSAQRLFLFSFHARGMSFVDLAFLKKSDIQGKLLTYRRRKTGQLLEITLTPEMRRIIDSFHEETKDSPYLFPIIQRPGVDEYRQYENGLKRQNRQLKRLATLVQLKVESKIGLSQSGTRGRLAERDAKLNRRSARAKVKSEYQNKEFSNASIRKPNNSQLSTFHFQLSTHMSRHTWASLAKQLNYPLAAISEALGHTSERTTAIYLASFDREVLDRMNRKISKAVKIVV